MRREEDDDEIETGEKEKELVMMSRCLVATCFQDSCRCMKVPSGLPKMSTRNPVGEREEENKYKTQKRGRQG